MTHLQDSLPVRILGYTYFPFTCIRIGIVMTIVLIVMSERMVLINLEFILNVEGAVTMDVMKVLTHLLFN